MSEKLISADKLIMTLESMQGTRTHATIENIIYNLKIAPAVDAVEVVRCGKCVYRNKFMQDIYYCIKDGLLSDNLPNRIVEETDFCSLGKRRDGNAVD